MCGIAGFVGKNNKISKKDREFFVNKMLYLIKHRGGDAYNVKSFENITMGHTRLSIVDRSPLSNQPYSTVDNSFMLSFNGEIYNFKELAKKYFNPLAIVSKSDTVILFELLRNFSIKSVLTKIEGMFAFSFFNNNRKVINLVLDRFAIKPLYYVDTPEFFAWASEIKAFKALPNFKFETNESVLGEFMVFRYVAGNSTLFKNVYRLQAGEHLTYDTIRNSILNTKKYYQLKKTNRTVSFSEKLISSTVKKHLIGDAEAGVQLSGGVDSSLVTFFTQKFSKKPIHTFSIGLKDKKWNEFYFSNKVAKKLGTQHHKITFSKKDFVRYLREVAYYLDEPLVHPNTIPMFILAKEARKYTKVLLTGEGADEVFLGYDRYLYKKSSQDDLIFANAFNHEETVSRIFKKSISVINRKKILDGAKKLKLNDKLSFNDIYTYLPHVLLRQDKAGMAANVENRVPFLDRYVVEEGFNSTNKIGKFGGKNQIKKIALKYFSKDIVLRKKCGFGLPISDWLRDKDGLLSHLLRLKESQLIKNFFNIKEINIIIDDHLRQKKDNSSILFTLISLTIWHDIFITNNS